ncbi:MAG: glycerophosphodiester phosphodiesterase family protein [Myxococcota bacterium]
MHHQPLVLGHRGAPGYLPDHTLEGYTLAIAQGADYIEPDLVSTADGVLVARHENELSQTTDVAERFPDRRAEREVDGQHIEGWFVEDLTLAELRTLRARQPMPQRPHDHDGQYLVPTFDEVLDLAVAKSAELGRPIGVYPETKHPTYFRERGLPLEPPMLASLRAHGLDRRDAPVFVQSFEAGNLRALRAETELRLVQLVDDGADLSPAALAEIATYADAVGVPKSAVLDPAGVPTALVHDAHRAGLLVHVYTFRADPQYLPDWAAGDFASELHRYYDAGVDGVFSDFPDRAVAARQGGAAR